MISVCMATRNGARYIAEQLNSILPQLRPEDEIVISDDKSTDETLTIIKSFGDKRIRLIENETTVGIPGNFENSLKVSRGAYIFLADQDDVWLNTKVKVMKRYLEHHDLVISDCQIVDHKLDVKAESYFSVNRSRNGLIRNLFRNSYMGCCMAFNRKVLDRALPFPKEIPIHDFWIGMIGEMYFDVRFIPDKLIKHRRHSSNASTTGGESVLTLLGKIKYRYKTLKRLFLHQRYAA